MKAENKLLATNLRAVKLVSKWQKWYIPSIILCTLFGDLSPFVTIYMSAEIVNELIGARDIQRLIGLVLFTVIVDLLLVIIGGLLTKFKNYEKQAFENVGKRMFTDFGFHMDYEHLENPEIRKYRRKIDESSNINAFGIESMLISFEIVTRGFIQIILSVCFTSSLFSLIFKQASGLVFAVFIVLMIALSACISLKNAKKLSKLYDGISNNMLNISRIGRGYREAYTMGKDIRIYNMVGIFIKHRERSLKAQKEGNRKFDYGIRNTQIPDQIISQGLHFTIYAFVCLNAVRGLFEVGSVIKYVGFISKFVNGMNSLLKSVAMLRMNQSFLEHYLGFFEIENKMYQGTLPVEKREDNEYEIEFHNVSFKYPGSETYALKNLSMKFQIGQRLAVVGMNGSGKTTMIKLLCRLYDPTEGEITLNGANIKKYDYEEYMNIFSVVFQDFKLFSFTLGQNVASCVDYDAKKTKNCLEMAGFADRLSNMPKGLETPLYKDFEEDGVEISGGESQKIALARALYKNAPFIILDEPTAALDPIAEYEIYSKFDDIVGKKSAVYISHRLSSCRFCDDIAVFHEGRLIARGGHDELIGDTNGKYYELWHAQAQYYADDTAASA